MWLKMDMYADMPLRYHVLDPSLFLDPALSTLRRTSECVCPGIFTWPTFFHDTALRPEVVKIKSSSLIKPFSSQPMLHLGHSPVLSANKKASSCSLYVSFSLLLFVNMIFINISFCMSTFRAIIRLYAIALYL